MIEVKDTIHGLEARTRTNKPTPLLIVCGVLALVGVLGAYFFGSFDELHCSRTTGRCVVTWDSGDDSTEFSVDALQSATTASRMIRV